MRIQLTGVAVAALLARAATAQTPPQQSTDATPVGVWRGTSTCLIRPSACNDEIVVYRIARLKAVDSLTLDARKIVRGEEQEMGVLTCYLVPTNGDLSCTIPQGVWHFRVRSDSLIGELRLRNNAKFRDVRALRAP
ncbi:MAG: hypothetical protein JWL61_2469 [Gemmatimonadetes bacterium]|nr:hypothetical protein [Gemmatimonadota bacterium]